MTDGTFDLEGMPEPPPRVQRKVKTPTLSWSRYKVTSKTVHCDTCLQVVHEKWPHGTHAPNLAVFKRTDKKGVISYWCWEHGTDQRAKDGIADPKGKKAR